MFEESYILLLAGGFILLLAGGEFLVRGAVSLASSLRVSTLVIGVTVVSLGTSAPELVVSVSAVLKGHHGIATGNVIGSNIANIGLVLGVTVLIMPVVVNSRKLLVSWGVMMAVTLLLLLFLLDGTLSGREGGVLLLILALFIFFSMRASRRSDGIKSGDLPVAGYSIPLAVLITILSCISLALGARLLIDGASGIARVIGVSERLISVSVVAFGTSLPELVTSAVAAVRRQTDISIGNILGSNIFNVLIVMGAASVVRDINIPDRIVDFDMLWCIGLSLVLLFLVMPPGRIRLGRFRGALLLAIYISYILFAFLGERVPLPDSPV